MLVAVLENSWLEENFSAVAWKHQLSHQSCCCPVRTIGSAGTGGVAGFCLCAALAVLAFASSVLRAKVCALQPTFDYYYSSLTHIS